mmetsp:Transcript_33132/g.33741  ORF Transcript_33132/g.33741 Transcript_33132/m.33741 type:complete len:268 (+) Transcript_33132:458-1261(+)
MYSEAHMNVPMKVVTREYSNGEFSDSPPMNGGPFRLTTNTLTCWTAVTRNTTELTRLGENTFDLMISSSGERCLLHSLTRYIIVTKCKANCPISDKNKAGWKIDRNGRTGDNCCNGFDREIVIKETDINIPKQVICTSPYLIPSRRKTDREYALIKQFKAKIWYIWMVVTRVHLPCLMMSNEPHIDGIFEVKGEATDASPILIMGCSSSSMLCMPSMKEAIFPADPVILLFWARVCLALTASRSQMIFIALNKGQLSPSCCCRSYSS